MHCRCVRVTLTLAAIASWARPAASFASMPGSALPTDEYSQALIEAALHGCSASERNRHVNGVEKAAENWAEDTDKDGDGFISRVEADARRGSIDAEAIAVAEAVGDELPTNQCLVVLINEKMSMTTPVAITGRMLKASREHHRRLELSDEQYDIAVKVLLWLASHINRSLY